MADVLALVISSYGIKGSRSLEVAVDIAINLYGLASDGGQVMRHIPWLTPSELARYCALFLGGTGCHIPSYPYLWSSSGSCEKHKSCGGKLGIAHYFWGGSVPHSLISVFMVLVRHSWEALRVLWQVLKML